MTIYISPNPGKTSANEIAPRTAYVHSHAAGSDRGCDPPDRRGYGKVFPDEKR